MGIVHLSMHCHLLVQEKHQWLRYTLVVITRQSHETHVLLLYVYLADASAGTFLHFEPFVFLYLTQFRYALCAALIRVLTTENSSLH